MRLRAVFAFPAHLLAIGAGLAAFAFATSALAVGTRTFELDTLDKLSGGDLKGVSVGSDGIVRAGWTLGDVRLPESAGATATCAVELPDGSVLVGTARGKVVQVAMDQATVFADTKESAVNALAVDKAGVVYAATTSNKIYKLTQGKAEVFATLHDAESVFALATDPRGGAVYVGGGSGSSGKVLRVEPGGAATVYFRVNEPFVVSLAVAPDGVVYAGTGSKALLYRIRAEGHATVLYDFPGEDVHAIAIGPNGIVWAIANEGGSSSESTESPHRTSARAAPGPTVAPKPKAGKGSLWRFDAKGRPERLMHHDDFHYLSLALDDGGVPYVGTGAEGRVYTVDDAHQVFLLADTDERQIGALAISGKGRFVVGSDPAAVHRVLAVGKTEARRGSASRSTPACARASATFAGAAAATARCRRAPETRRPRTPRGARGARRWPTAARSRAPAGASCRCEPGSGIRPRPSPTSAFPS